jgi:hypothetical protein
MLACILSFYIEYVRSAFNRSLESIHSIGSHDISYVYVHHLGRLTMYNHTSTKRPPATRRPVHLLVDVRGGVQARHELISLEIIKL